MNSTNIKVISEEIQRLKDQVHAIDVEVPDPSQATDGQILSVDDGKYVISDPELPSVTSASTGDVLGLVGEEKTPGWITPYNPLDYSTNEQNTGLKWIDGKTIYRKTVFMEDPIVSTDSVNVATNVDKVIHFNGIMSRVKTDDTGDKIFFDLSDYLSTTNHNAATCELTTNGVLSFKVIFTIAETFKISLVIANIYYTKNDVTETQTNKKKTTTKKGE